MSNVNAAQPTKNQLGMNLFFVHPIHSAMRWRLTLIRGGLCGWLLTAVSTFAATNTVQIFNFDFGQSPATHLDPTISPGDTVLWTWIGGTHSTTATAGQAETWDSGLHTTGFTFTHTFTELGTYTYFCSQHGSQAGCGSTGGMSGRIFVVSPGQSALRVTAITVVGPDVQVNWSTGNIFCKTNALQRATGTANGDYTNEFADIFLVTNAVSAVTNYLDRGAVTNFPTRYYRIRQVP